MIPSALEWVDAFQEANRAVTPEEKEAAAGRLVAAELRHYEKLGLERRPGNVFLRTVVPTLLVAMVSVTLVLVVIFSAKANSTSGRVADLQREGIINNRESCQRTNAARVASIEEKEKSVVSLDKQLAFWEAAIEQSKDQPPSPLTGVFLTFVQGLREEVATKEASIKASIDSQAAVAIKPGSPRTDCASAYPFH